MKTYSICYVFPQRESNAASYWIQNALKFPDWKVIDYQTTVILCNRDHSSSLVLEKLRIKPAPPRAGTLWDRCPLQSSTVNTRCFHQPPAPGVQPRPLAAQSSPLSLQPREAHGSLAAAWQSGEPAMAAAAFAELSHARGSPGAAGQGEALPAPAELWDMG